jgi:16S rRNA (cytosine1402-N4)-methyltransferase
MRESMVTETNEVFTLPDGHVTVLLHEAVDAIGPVPGGVYIDGTFGGGGHASLLLERVGGDATLYAIDADPDAIHRARLLAASLLGHGVVPVHANFSELAEIARERNIEQVDGVLLDLGLSSFQLDQPERGFAFRFEGPLDMRFDPSRGPSAAELVNSLDATGLADLLWRYGEESRSRQIARAIVQHRDTRPIVTTTELAAIVETAVGGRRGKAIHPATKTFQALRIAVNEELSALETVLQSAIDLLRPGGRIAVISFHSLEDRIIKQTFARASQACICPPDQPVCTCDHWASVRRVGKPVRPSAGEIAGNPRSRSAIMRVAERIAQPGAGRS